VARLAGSETAWSPVALVAAIALVPAAAVAHRRATKGERTAILKAVVRQRELSHAACPRVIISTVDRRYAVTTSPATLSRACMRVAANGVIIEHS
jgi:hypothetical protein